MSPDHATSNVAKTRVSRDRRFQEHFAIEKLNKERPGPGQYDILKYLDQARIKPCPRMIKPVLVDEHLYEIVGGTARVCKPSLMNKPQRAQHDLAISNFFRTANETQK